MKNNTQTEPDNTSEGWVDEFDIRFRVKVVDDNEYFIDSQGQINHPIHIPFPREIKDFIRQTLDQAKKEYVFDQERIVKENVARAIQSEREKNIQIIRDNFQRMIECYDGKLPFVILGQTATDEEALSFYKQGLEDSIKWIEDLSQVKERDADRNSFKLRN